MEIDVFTTGSVMKGGGDMTDAGDLSDAVGSELRGGGEGDGGGCVSQCTSRELYSQAPTSCHGYILNPDDSQNMSSEVLE